MTCRLVGLPSAGRRWKERQDIRATIAALLVATERSFREMHDRDSSGLHRAAHSTLARRRGVFVPSLHLRSDCGRACDLLSLLHVKAVAPPSDSGIDYPHYSAKLVASRRKSGGGASS